MKSRAAELIEFKFKWVGPSKALTGNGSFDGTHLRFGEFSLLVDSIENLQLSESTFFLGATDGEGNPLALSVEIFGTDVPKLEKAINASRSDAVAARERERLIHAGQIESYRDAVCPCCNATILLLKLPETPQVYCEYCNTLFSRHRNEMTDIEQHFRLCETCEMYSRPRPFSVFYFYYLVVTFGFHFDQTVRCSGCMRSSAWKMVLGNLFGLFGFPFALVQLYRSWSTKKLTGVFEGLDDANLLARSGRIDKALEKYDAIMDRVPDNAGVKFNIATGLMLKHDYESAERMFELSLDDCANYWPSLHGLLECLQQLGKTEKLAAAMEFWNLRV